MDAVLHRALDRATVWDHVPRNGADAVDPPRVPKPEMEPPSVDQLVHFMDVSRQNEERLWVGEGWGDASSVFTSVHARGLPTGH